MHYNCRLCASWQGKHVSRAACICGPASAAAAIPGATLRAPADHAMGCRCCAATTRPSLLGAAPRLVLVLLAEHQDVLSHVLGPAPPGRLTSFPFVVFWGGRACSMHCRRGGDLFFEGMRPQRGGPVGLRAWLAICMQIVCSGSLAIAPQASPHCVFRLASQLHLHVCQQLHPSGSCT